MEPVLDFDELGLRGALDIAVRVEEDAQPRYEDLARLAVSGPAAVAVRREDTAPAVYPDREVLATLLPRFDAATRAVAMGVVVEGRREEEVAAALGVSRRTVARKVARFLEVARASVVATIAAAALGGCAGPGDVAAHVGGDGVPRARRDMAPPGAEEADDGAPRGASASSVYTRDGVIVVSVGARRAPSPDESAPEPSHSPVAATVWPERAPPGAVAHITGRNLDAAEVLFGAAPARILDSTPQKVTVEVPPSTGQTVVITVRNRDGTSEVVGEEFAYE